MHWGCTCCLLVLASNPTVFASADVCTLCIGVMPCTAPAVFWWNMPLWYVRWEPSLHNDVQQIALSCEKQCLTPGIALKDMGDWHTPSCGFLTPRCVLWVDQWVSIRVVSLPRATVCVADSVSPLTSLEVLSPSLTPPVSPFPAVVFSCLHILHWSFKKRKYNLCSVNLFNLFHYKT